MKFQRTGHARPSMVVLTLLSLGACGTDPGGRPDETDAVTPASSALTFPNGQDEVVSYITIEDSGTTKNQYVVWRTIHNLTPYALQLRNSSDTFGYYHVLPPQPWTWHNRFLEGTVTNVPPFTVARTSGLYAYGKTPGKTDVPMTAPTNFGMTITDLNTGLQLTANVPGPCVFQMPNDDLFQPSGPAGRRCYCDHYGTWTQTNLERIGGNMIATFSCL